MLSHWLIALAMIAQGNATYYAPGVMEEVYQNRLRWNQVQPCEECIDQVSMIDCKDIGAKVWIQHSENPNILEGPFLVVDCAPAKDQYKHIQANHIVEVSHAIAMRWRMSGPIPVNVYMIDPPQGESAIDHVRLTIKALIL